MSFGRNPFPAKAEVAEQKAADTTDPAARRGFYLDAAHQWDRAAAKEKPGRHRAQYEANAARDRALAEGPEVAEDWLN